MSAPVLERRPTHKALPLLRSEVSRITHRRFFRVLALILLASIVIISALVFVFHSKDSGLSADQLQQIKEQQQQTWERCVEKAQRRCGPNPAEQVIDEFNYTSDDRYLGYEALPIVVIGVSIAAAGVTFLVGASSGGAEWSSRSMTLQLLFEPRRLRLLVVKWLGLLLAAVALAVVALLVAVGLAALTTTFRGTWDPRFALTDELREHLWSTLFTTGLRGLVLVVIAGTIGYAIAMLVRNTGASLGVAFVYFVVIENGVRFALIRYGTEPFMLSTNSVTFLVPGGLEVPGKVENGDFESNLVKLTNLRSFVTLMIYAVLLSLPAAWSFTRRDVS